MNTLKTGIIRPKSRLKASPLLNNFKYLAEAIDGLDQQWQDFLFTKCYTELLSIDNKLSALSHDSVIYPSQELIFNAFCLTSLSNTKVVILGQDPYHGENEANGLAFSVNAGIKLPPSLKNIYKELSLEYSVPMNADGTHLYKWATQGVLLLNASLTVIKDRANSLSSIGWQQVTDKLIQYISTSQFGVVFMFWGAYAQQKSYLVDTARHLILTAAHPSPLSAYRGFHGCNHFRLANEYLVSLGKTAIDWV
jgi:uracil-DNA glycosylase